MLRKFWEGVPKTLQLITLVTVLATLSATVFGGVGFSMFSPGKRLSAVEKQLSAVEKQHYLWSKVERASVQGSLDSLLVSNEVQVFILCAHIEKIHVELSSVESQSVESQLVAEFCRGMDINNLLRRARTMRSFGVGE
jgi:hypothetical protein